MKLFSPAKINLFLAVTGRRPDGFHSLVSLVAPLEFGDHLEISPTDASGDVLRCEYPGVPMDGSNLVLRAAEVFRRRSGVRQFFEFDLEKRIPAGGGFGGGSGNAVTALRGMNAICGEVLDSAEMLDAATELGSDCPLFLDGGPVVMRGRGEEVQPVPELSHFLASRRVFLFSPRIFSSTASLFRSMADRGVYTSNENAESLLGDLMKSIQQNQYGLHLQNDLGTLLAEKYLYYDTLGGLLRKDGIREFAVTGSGSGAFALARRESDWQKIRKIGDRFLEGCGFMIETRFLGNNVVPTASF